MRRFATSLMGQMQTCAAQKDRYSITSLARPSSVAGISMPSALTFENIGMLPVFNPEVCNGWQRGPYLWQL